MRTCQRFVVLAPPLRPSDGWTVAIVQPRNDANQQDPRRRAVEPTRSEAFDLACVISWMTGMPIVDTSMGEVAR